MVLMKYGASLRRSACPRAGEAIKNAAAQSDRPHTRVSDAGRLRDGAAYSAAGVRKPPREETALFDRTFKLSIY